MRLLWEWRKLAHVMRPDKQMASDNPTWGAPRIRSELRILGYRVAESTVAKYMDRKGNPGYAVKAA